MLVAIQLLLNDGKSNWIQLFVNPFNLYINPAAGIIPLCYIDALCQYMLPQPKRIRVDLALILVYLCNGSYVRVLALVELLVISPASVLIAGKTGRFGIAWGSSGSTPDRALIAALCNHLV